MDVYNDARSDKSRSADSGTAGGAESSARLDSAKVNIRVEWAQRIPERWKGCLQKALQGWFSTTLSEQVKETCNAVNLQLLDDPCHAVVEISPSKALDVLKKLKSATLIFKELKRCAIVHFLVDETETLYEAQKSVPAVEEEKMPVPEVDMFFTAYMDLDKCPSNIQTELKRRFGNPEFVKNLSFSGPFHLIEKNYREVCGIVGGSETGMAAAAAMKNDLSRAETPQHAEKSGAPPAFTIPLFQYLYFSRAFRNELSQYEKEFGVKIKADVSVSVTAVDQTRSSSVQEAAQRFIDFYHHSTQALQCVNIPQTQLESEIVKEAVHHIQSDQTKMMLNMSADQCLLFGPEPLISTVQKRMDRESRTASKIETVTSKRWTLEMDFKDTQDPIMMNETHYVLVKKTSQRPIQNIEQKYGVGFTAAPSQDSIKDKSRSADSGTAGGAESSARLDSAKVNIRVEWAQRIPERWKGCLQKALQGWFSTTLSEQVKETCNAVNLQLLDDPCHAVVEISPSKALDVLKKLKSATLIFKELKRSAIVHFLVDETETLYEAQKSVPAVEEEKMPVPEVDMFFTAYMDLDKCPSNIQTELKRRFGNPEFGKNLSFSGPFHLIEKNYREVCGIVGGSETGMAAAAAMKNDLSRAETPQHAEKSGAPPAFTIPLFQYLYFSRAFRNELSQYEKEFGVKIKADVSVSVTAVDQTRSSSVQEAAQRFIDFYHHSTQALQCVNIPQTQLESEIVKEAVHHIQSDQTKMMLNMSADQCLLFGPEPLISTFQKEINNQGAGAAGRTDGPSLKSRAQATSELGKVAKEKESVKSKHDDCPICMDKFTGKQKLKCGHEFCKECLEASVKCMGEICPVCKNVFGKLMGNQPERTKDSSEQSHRPFGYPSRGTTEIACSIPAGVQRVDSLLDAVTDLDKRPLNERSEAPPALTVPLSQYWYLSHAFRKELSQIEKEFGVKINAEVSVSVTAVDQIRGDSVNKATRRVTDLVQNSMKGLQCAKIPHTQVESEILKEVVRNIRMDRAKMMINVSADQCLLFGPEPVMSGVEEQMNLEPGVKLERSSVCSAPGKLETDRDLRKASGNARAK
ncbi:hypothetical protein AOLI_G00245580 [Acnodon oligacanthus]